MREGNARPAVSYQRECRICGKKFETRAKKQIYCCQECACAAKTIKEKASVRINIIHGTSSALDGMPRGSGTSDTTADKAMRILALDGDIDAIEKALNTIRPEYRHSVMTLIMTGKVPLNAYASRRTVGRWKAKLLYTVAKNKFWI